MNELKATINDQLQQLQMLMHRASFSHFGKMHNPHRGQGRVLALLKLKPEISQRELTYLLNMSKQAVAELLSKLERSGYITREPSPDDKRAMIIHLTEKGAEATDEVDDTMPSSGKMLDCLNDEELTVFSDYLGRIIAKYEEQFPDEAFEQRRQMMDAFMVSHGGFGRGPHGQPGHGYEGQGRHPGYDRGSHGHPDHGYEGQGRNPGYNRGPHNHPAYGYEGQGKYPGDNRGPHGHPDHRCEEHGGHPDSGWGRRGPHPDHAFREGRPHPGEMGYPPYVGGVHDDQEHRGDEGDD